ncbi:MAG: ISAs1 family transposase [Oscillibacter sp.]|nr:ISAs1 family transposase [Oscillibacter sp.]
MEEIRARLSEIEDQRHPSYVKYPLAEILIIVMCAVLCGLDTLGDLVIYAKNRKEFLAKEFGIEAIPSKATFARVLSSVNGKAIGDAILDILRMRFGVSGEVIAVDGKAICSTAKPGNPHSALQILSAYMTDNGVVLAQEAIHEKTNEIPVFQEMLTYLDVEGKTVTADAMHCQRETCRRIIQRKGNYLFGLKENQPSLLKDVRLFFENADRKELDSFQTAEKNAGRIEKRVCRKIKDISWLNEHKWPGLQSVFSIERTVETHGRSSKEVSFYISSCDSSPEFLMTMAREHWKIESMHWLLDVTFSEDNCRLLSENAHRTMNALRKFALALHKNFLAAYHKNSSIKAHMLSALLDSDLLLSILHFL